MKIPYGLAVVVLVLLSVSMPSRAADPGTTGANILNFGVGARAIAMGEAYTSLADDVSSLYWNPAGIALLNQSEASFMYNQSLKDLTYNHAAVGMPLENGGLGASLSYLNFGSINGFDSQGNPTGNVNAYSGVATFGGALLGDTWSLGANVKGVQTALADMKVDGVAFDFGGNVIYPKEVLGGSTLRLAAAVRNLGPGMTFLQQTDPFPTEWRIGISALQMLNRKLTLSMDYGKRRDEDGSVYGGAEYWPCPYVALRTGYAGSHAEGSGLRAGIGLRFKSISFDYAYSNYGDLGLTSRYELSYRFGEIRSLLNAEERRMLKRAKIAMKEGRYDEAVLLLDSLITMEPHYKMFRHLIRTAMNGQQIQDRLAQKERDSNVLSLSSINRQGSVSDLDDLEQLLLTADVAMGAGTASNKPAGTAPQEPKQ